mmetsp:Transcript_27337/g.82011  ORF Transcript_27337/g.82011 Transcript_27337/m.82011 type:complete len:142 (+) Transcript_27337:130-555(+)
MELRQFLTDAYPQVRSVRAEQYPPPQAGVIAQQVAGMAQIAMVALFLGGEKIFQAFGAPTPPWYHSVAENKFMTFGMVWMANNVAASMVATGAFEIVVDGQLIYSKLETGRLPSAGQIISGMSRLGLETEQKDKYLGGRDF